MSLRNRSFITREKGKDVYDLTSLMEELIIKYLTDRLNDGEMERFTTAMQTDSVFRKEFKAYHATLALTDLSLNYPRADNGRFSPREIENKTECTTSKYI